MTPQLWLVLQVKLQITDEEGNTHHANEVVGIFDDEEKAKAAATGYWDFVMPLALNEVAPRETVICNKGYYPSETP